MSLTLSGTNGVVGAGFTIDPSGINVAVGVVTATSINANASGLTGELPAGIDIPAAQIVGVCTSGLTKTGGFGKIVQVVSTTKTDTFSEDTANATYTAAALAATITPSSASNKILVSVNATASMETASRIGFGIFKAGSILTSATGDADGSRTRVTSQADAYSAGRAVFIGGEFSDTAGGTSAITYDVRLIHGQGSTKFLYLNRSSSSTNNANYLLSTSTLTLTEIQA